MYKPRPILVWKLKAKDRARISCHCGKPARYGRSADGGAPYFYECAKHVPAGRGVVMVSNSRELVAAVRAR